MSESTVRAFQARYVFPIATPPVRGGMHVVGPHGATRHDLPATVRPIDLGNAAIVPGLVNAHTHLELSCFDAPIGDPSHGFAGWIESVVRWRISQSGTDEAERCLAYAESVRRGVEESYAAGVTMLGDIVSQHSVNGDAMQWRNAAQATNFYEILGLKTPQADELLTRAANVLQHAAWQPPHFGAISPHAPYTVGVDLLRRSIELARERQTTVAMHLAESWDELELLQSHSGALQVFLEQLGAWDPSAVPRGIAVREYLQILAQAPRAIVVHGNYLEPEEIDFLAEHRERMSVVYCPRTHAWFGHPRYPLMEMLAKGVNVALGTDSRASNPDLNLWDELRFVADHYPELSLEQILRLVTANGAQALGRPSPLWVEGGSTGTFSIIDLPDDDPADPYELLFDPRSRVREVYVEGRRVWPAE